MAKAKRWTLQEEARLVEQVRIFPQNLSKCFLIVSEVIDRSPCAVANHWYTKLSKDPKNLCFFTASAKHVSKNRKNGIGIETKESIWKKFLRILKTI